jgi:hypothetical protein
MIALVVSLVADNEEHRFINCVSCGVCDSLPAASSIGRNDPEDRLFLEKFQSMPRNRWF